MSGLYEYGIHRENSDYRLVFYITGSGLVLDWEQESGMLLASGDVRIIRVWDTQRELRLQVSVLHYRFGSCVRQGTIIWYAACIWRYQDYTSMEYTE